MAKKNKEVDGPDIPDFDSGTEPGGDEEGTALGAMDFNVDDEYKPDPLIPKGTYHAVVTKVSFTPAQSCIVWDICLHDNGGIMNDGETPIDGAHIWFRNWLPKPGDENELTKSGNNNKRQSKINMLKDFSKELGIDMSTPVKIAESLANAEWIGIEVDADVDIDEYMGRFRNNANRLRASKAF